MSLFRKIRRRHKAFGLKSSKQTTTVDQAPSVSSAEDGDDGDEDDDAVGITGMQGTPIVKISAQPGDVSERSSPHATKGDVFGRRSQFWPRIATTGILLLLSLGAFYVGKLATVGITLCILLACKLSARHCVVSSNHSQADRRGDSIPVSPKNRNFDGIELDESPFESFIVNDDNNGVEMDVEVNSHNKDEETFSGGGSLSTKKKQLKRLNCLKLPPSVLPLGEALEEYPSSAKASPRTWFCSAGSSTVIETNRTENLTEFRKETKHKSKVFFRRLRKGEPHSTPSSPLWSDSEAVNGFSPVSDGSDSERAILSHSAMNRVSKFKPVSLVAKEHFGAEASMVSLDLASGLGDTQPTPQSSDSSRMREDGKPDGCTAAFCKSNMKQKNISFPLPKDDQSARIPPTTTSGGGMTKIEMPAFVVTTQEPSWRRGGTHQSAWKPVAARCHTALVNRDASSSRAAILKRADRTQQKLRSGTIWLASGLAIITAGLLMGRMVAITGLVCYWYAFSHVKKRTNALDNQRQKQPDFSGFQ
ncbi:hypothetical protein L7F22_037319 [Adiantum nelumboides]|nr:hypothetical protein [Adiantum nelumboides]